MVVVLATNPKTASAADALVCIVREKGRIAFALLYQLTCPAMTAPAQLVGIGVMHQGCAVAHACGMLLVNIKGMIYIQLGSRTCPESVL